MSGPKTSRYRLTPEQRRILEEQRRKAVAAGKIRKDQKKLLQIGGMFSAERQIADELTARGGDDNGISALFKELDALIAPIHPLVSRTNFDDVKSVEGTSDTISEWLKEAEEIASKISEISSINEACLNSDLQKAIDGGFTASFVDIKEIKTDGTASLRSETEQRLAQMQRSDFLPRTYKDEISSAITRLKEITDDIFLKNFVAVSVNPIIKKADGFIAEYRQCRDEFDRLYAEYAVLCELYGYVAQEYVCSRSSIQTIEAEIERIKKAAAEDDEQAYISDCLDEVMVEMGYTVLGSREVTKRNGKRFRSELYSYGEGTAVNITYSADGKIVMELGGIDTSDRVPTAQETDKICDSMEQFCDDFKEIEKRLLAKGVVLADRVSLLPPDAQYAQIINTSDYSMEAEAGSISVKKQRRSASGQKALRRE